MGQPTVEPTTMATRIKDGIFVADGESSQDGEFVEMNKISYVINCC